jgi:Cu-Zn family superoxide dismutase
MKFHIYSILALFAFSACSSPEAAKEETKETVTEEVKEMKPPAKNPTVSVTLSALGNSEMSGVVKFAEKDGVVYMKAKFEKVTQGKHAIHFHEFGDCSAADGSSAGGHWNPTNEDHGKWGVPPFHRGDIGNFEADNNGNAAMKMETDLWCIGCEDPVKNILGKSIIVHAGEDDCTSQPSGNAGARIACGVVENPM